MARYEPVEMNSEEILKEWLMCDKNELYMIFTFRKERTSESSFIEWSSVEERVVS